jgi:hypothetical protein
MRDSNVANGNSLEEGTRPMPFASQRWMNKRARGCFFSEQMRQLLMLPKDQEAAFQRFIPWIDSHYER